MNNNLLKIKAGDILRVLIIALLSVLAFIARGIYTQQADIARRMHIVELNQAKIMTVLGIEPYSSDTKNQHFLSGISQ